MQQLHVTATYTDLYQLTMGQVHFLKGHHQQDAVFDYFFRKLPFGGGYVVLAGLGDLLETIATLRFLPEELEYLKKIGLNARYVDFLEGFRFNGDIYAVREGELVFPYVPSIRV